MVSTRGWCIDAMNNAAKNGHFDVVKWLHGNRTEGCTKNAMNWAASQDIVKWLHENRTEGCTTRAMDGAAADGHLMVVKWLHENRIEGCTTQAMDSRGHMDMVKWLHENMSEGCTAKGLDSAAYFDRWDIVKWLLLNRTDQSSEYGCLL